MTRNEIEAALAQIARFDVPHTKLEAMAVAALRALLRALPVLEAAHEEAIDHGFKLYQCDCRVCEAVREYDRQEEAHDAE